MGGKGSTMAEKEGTNTATTEVDGEQVEQTDVNAELEKLKAESRKWEKRAKDGNEKIKELEKQIEQANMTADEKAKAQLAEQAAELAALKAEKARMESANEIAGKTGVPLEVIQLAADADAMEALAKLWKEREEANEQPVYSAPSTGSQRLVKTTTKGQAPKNRDVFAQLFN